MKLLLSIFLLATLPFETLIEKGEVALDSTQFEAATDYFEEALPMVPTDSFELLTDIYNRLTFAYYNQNLYPEAEHYCRLSLNMNEKIGDAYGISTSYALLSGIMMHQGNDNIAEEYMLKALEVDQSFTSKQQLAKHLVKLANIFTSKIKMQTQKIKIEEQNLQLERKLHQQQMLIVVVSILLILLIAIVLLIGHAYHLERDMSRTEQSARQLLQPESTPSASLSDRELDIVRLCCKGKLSKEIAEELNISKKTVDNHKSSIYKKLGVGNNTELIIYAAKHNLIEL